MSKAPKEAALGQEGPAEFIALADRIDAMYGKASVGDVFATMCLMSDARRALGLDPSLVGNKLTCTDLAAALREAAALARGKQQ